MKNLKRVTVFAVIMAMVLSLLSFGVYADEPFALTFKVKDAQNNEVTDVVAGATVTVEVYAPVAEYKSLTIVLKPTGNVTNEDVTYSSVYPTPAAKGVTPIQTIQAKWTSAITPSETTPVVTVKMTVPPDATAGDYTLMSINTFAYSITGTTAGDTTTVASVNVLEAADITDVTNYADITDKELGATVADLDLPATVPTTTKSVSNPNGSYDCPVTWDTKDYESTILTEQTITGTLEPREPITNTTGKKATIKVTLGKITSGATIAEIPAIVYPQEKDGNNITMGDLVAKATETIKTVKVTKGEFEEDLAITWASADKELEQIVSDLTTGTNVATITGTVGAGEKFDLTDNAVTVKAYVKPAVIVSDESGVTASVTNKNITESSDIIITVEREDAEEAADISVVITPEGGTSVTVPQKDEDKANFVLAAGKTSGSFNLGTLAELFGTAPGEGTKLTFEIQYNGSTIVANEGDTATAIETVAPKSNGSNRPGGLPSSTGGGSTAVTYKITVEEAENGTVSVSPTTAAQGTTVTITTKGNEGYKTDKITVKTSRGTDVSVTDKKFTMPAYDVTVSVTFVEGEEEPDVVKGPFDDVAADFWAAEAITKLKEMGVINGETASTFNPNGNVTRAEFAKMVAELFDLKATTTTTAFVDCAPGDWFTSYVIAATEAGYVKGTSETTFSPNDQITRQDICTILGRALNAAPAADGAMVFSDADQIADYAYDYVLSFVGMSIVNGYEDGTFKPTANATRAEAAKIIYGVAQLADNAEADNSQIAPVTTGDDETAPVDENVADDNAADENAEDVSADDNAEDENAEDAPVDDNAEDEPAE